MASPTTSTAPDAPSGSSPLAIGGFPRLVGWLREIAQFIKSLSPDSAAAYDTGWVTLTLESGWTAGGQTPQVRRVGKLIIFRGHIVNSTATTTLTRAFVIPQGFRPPASLNFPQSTNSVTTLAASAEAGGDMKFYASASTAGWRPLNGISYMVD